MTSLWAFWRAYGAAMGERQLLIWLWLVYFVVVGPTWAISRLARRSFDHAGWVERPRGTPTLADMRRLG